MHLRRCRVEFSELRVTYGFRGCGYRLMTDRVGLDSSDSGAVQVLRNLWKIEQSGSGEDNFRSTT